MENSLEAKGTKQNKGIWLVSLLQHLANTSKPIKEADNRGQQM